VRESKSVDDWKKELLFGFLAIEEKQSNYWRASPINRILGAPRLKM
jgi:hypothetical protein